MARPRKPVVVYCAEEEMCSRLAFLLETRLLTVRPLRAHTPAELEAHRASGPFAVIVLRDKAESRVEGFLAAVQPTLDTPVLQIAKSWVSSEACASTRTILSAVPAEVLAVVQQMIARKRGPKPFVKESQNEVAA